MASLLERLARSAAVEVLDDERGLRIKCPDRQTQQIAYFGDSEQNAAYVKRLLSEHLDVA